MTKKQKVSFNVTTENDIVLDDLAVEMNCAGFGEIEEIKVEDIFTCCLCKGVFTGWSNNAEPLVENGQCCKKCDDEKVIPERIRINNEQT